MPLVGSKITRLLWSWDWLLSRVFTCVAVSTGFLFFLIILFLAYEAWPLFQGDQWRGIFGREWYPLDGLFGMLPMILASFYVAFGVIVIAGPIGLLCAIGLASATPKLSLFGRAFQMLLHVFAGIPSVIFGFWGLTVIVPVIARWQPPGASLLSAILIVALMVLPTLIIAFSLALKAVPEQLILGAKAVGLCQVTLLCHVQLPAARFGIFNGLFLAVARALGETMAVVMVAGNVVQIPAGLFDPVRVLTANIALEMAYAMDIHRASLFASGLLLTGVIAILSWISSCTGRVSRQPLC